MMIPTFPISLTPNPVPFCYVFIGHWTYLSLLSYLSLSWLFPLSLADHIGLPHLFLLSLITPIFDCPLYYLVADCLLPYQCLVHYHVQMYWPTKRCLVGFGLCPLSLSTLLTRSHLAVYKMYQYPTWTLSLSFCTIRTSELETAELHKSFNFQSHSSLQLHRHCASQSVHHRFHPE